MYYLWKRLFLASAFLLALIFTDCTGEKESGKPGVLVSTAWLQDHLNDPDLVILHSGSAELFDSLHIPGARLIIPGNFTVNTDSLRNQMPPGDSIVALLRRVGVNNDSKIVLYYETSRLISRTARVYVSLDHIGLGGQTYVLNGGLPKWQEEDGESSEKPGSFTPGNLDPASTKEVIIGVNELDQQRWNSDVVVIDARSDEEYYGSPETEEYYADGGHIEGAYFLPYQDLLSEDNSYMFRSDANLKELFKKVGMDTEKRNVFYCGSGIRASVSYLAARHLGFPALLYDGSIEEWDELDMPLTGPVTLPDNNE